MQQHFLTIVYNQYLECSIRNIMNFLTAYHDCRHSHNLPLFYYFVFKHEMHICSKIKQVNEQKQTKNQINTFY